MMYYNPSVLITQKNQRIRRYEIDVVSTRYTLIDYFNRVLQFKWKRYNMISGGAWSWKRADSFTMGSGINWVRHLGVMGYFSPLNGDSIVTTLRSVYHLKLKSGANSIYAFAASPESYVGNELYNFNIKLQHRLIETMYNVFYMTKSSLPRSYYGKNNFTVSERESPLFENHSGAVCPFFAEMLWLDKIKNNCPTAGFDSKWDRTADFVNSGPRAVAGGVAVEKNSITHKLITKKNYRGSAWRGSSKISILGYFMRKRWQRSLFDPYHLFAFENPKYRFTSEDRLAVDVSNISNFKVRKERHYRHKRKNSTFWKKKINFFFGSKYEARRCTRSFLSRFDRLDPHSFNPVGKFKDMLNSGGVWEYYKDKIYRLPRRIRQSIGRARMSASILPNLQSLDKTISSYPALFEYYKRGLGVSFLLRPIRLFRTIAAPGGALHKLLARRKKRARARVFKKQQRPLIIAPQGYGGLRLVKTHYAPSKI